MGSSIVKYKLGYKPSCPFGCRYYAKCPPAIGNKRRLLYLTRGEFYRTVVKGHVITTLRIFEKKTNIGEENE